jgi:hypothetical protein
VGPDTWSDVRPHVGRRLLSTWTWLAHGSGRGYLNGYLMALAIFVLFILIDLIVVDWLVVCLWQPKWVVIKGTENAARRLSPAWVR